MIDPDTEKMLAQRDCILARTTDGDVLAELEALNLPDEDPVDVADATEACLSAASREPAAIDEHEPNRSRGSRDPDLVRKLHALAAKARAFALDCFKEERQDTARRREIDRYRREEGRLPWNELRRALYAMDVWEAQERNVRPYRRLEGLSDEERLAHKRELDRERQRRRRAGMTTDQKASELKTNAERRRRTRMREASSTPLGP